MSIIFKRFWEKKRTKILINEHFNLVGNDRSPTRTLEKIGKWIGKCLYHEYLVILHLAYLQILSSDKQHQSSQRIFLSHSSTCWAGHWSPCPTRSGLDRETVKLVGITKVRDSQHSGMELFFILLSENCILSNTKTI